MTKRKPLPCKEACACSEDQTVIPCGYGVPEYHHIKSFGSGGSNHAYNLMPLCRAHHSLTHSKGLMWMAKEYIGFYNALIDKKWEINPQLLKWVNYEPEVIMSSKKPYQL